ncbi:uncharacterized protein UTRI_01363 [Ustilago trichophora]|uniref:Uncharacterized protein n=1 Tax=Ustilago trichophora TaxID=86804 RepID=A0A5C3DWH5_9BASI|nr:uncharacterized protein UTRI_01363 [Ustilago trichophora]
MRSQNLARALLRSAVRNGTTANTRIAVPRSVSFAIAPTSSASLRSFATSGISLKKKNKKKDAFVAAEEEFNDEEFAIEEEDDLFGGVSSTTSASSTSSISSSPAMSRAEFAKTLEDYQASLSWESIDRGQFPSLSRFRNLAAHVSNQSELDSVLELASVYRDRVGSLGVESGKVFAARAGRIGLPEIALNAFLDRYKYGLEFDQEALYYVQKRLARKLARGNREQILQSVELPGLPVQEVDLLGMVAPATEAGTEAVEGQAGAEEGGKAEAIQAKHELDMPLARAQLSIIDRMCTLATLTPTPNPFLLSYITHAYITTFKLNHPNSTTNPLLTSIYTHTDNLISLLAISAQQVLSSTSSSTAELNLKKSIHLAKNLSSTLAYVAIRGQSKFNHPTNNTIHLDPVRTLYRFIDASAPQRSNVLLRQVEPLLQRYARV